VLPLASGPAMTTPLSHLLGGTAGIIATAVVAIVALALLITPVFWASKQRTQPRTGENTGAPGLESGPTLLGQARPVPGQGPGVTRPRLDAQHEDLITHGPGHPHGKPASWVAVAVMLAAFVAGGLSIITHLWWLLWTCLGIIAVAGIAAMSVGIMNDTVAYGSNPAAAPRADRELGTDRVRADGPYPGVSGETAP
jgi:hypothetical protein